MEFNTGTILPTLLVTATRKTPFPPRFAVENHVEVDFMIFDPINYRKNAFTPGMVEFFFKTEYDSSRPMGNVAASNLETAIAGWLVGLDIEFQPAISVWLEWIDRAIKADEEFGVDQNAHRTTLHWAKGIGEWMADGVNAEGEWDSARVFEEARWRCEKSPWSTNEIVKYGLDDYMAFAYQGGEHNDGFEAGIDMYERWTGQSGPVSLSKTLKPRDFGYALCLHRTARQQFDELDLLKAGRKMLQANLQENWLGGGQRIRAATWLKIVYWHNDGTLTPLQTILKAYDDMPKVLRPDFLPVN